MPAACLPACRLYARYMPEVVADFELNVRRTPIPLLDIQQEVGGVGWLGGWLGDRHVVAALRSLGGDGLLAAVVMRLPGKPAIQPRSLQSVPLPVAHSQHPLAHICRVLQVACFQCLESR